MTSVPNSLSAFASALRTAFWLGIAVLLGTSPASAGPVTRSVQSGPPPVIDLQVTPPAQTVAYTVEEQLPAQTLAAHINEGGTFDRATRKVKWGPFTNAAPQHLQYELTGPAGSYSLSGQASFDGNLTATGSTTVTLPDPASYYLGWKYTHFPAGTVDSLLADPASDPNENGVTLLQAYTFTGKPGAAPSDAAVHIGTNATQNGLFTATFPKNPEAQDTLLVPQTSTDLQDWHDLPTADYTRETGPTNGPAETVSLQVLPSALGSGSSDIFFRLKLVWGTP